MSNKPPNPRQMKFVELYLASGNAAQSYINAGYKAGTKVASANAARLLANESIRALIDDARAAANRNLGITAEWFAARVKLEAEREGPGSSHAGRVSALKLAGDLLGAFQPQKHELSGPNGAPIQTETVTDRIARYAAAIESAAARGFPAEAPKPD